MKQEFRDKFWSYVSESQVNSYNTVNALNLFDITARFTHYLSETDMSAMQSYLQNFIFKNPRRLFE
jgi:hypothetical protein